MSENDFTEQRVKWERWLAERQAANNLDEPLLVFVDDEDLQLDHWYDVSRILKAPGRNILLFQSAQEAAEFFEFSKQNDLNIALVASDWDNGDVSTTTGTEVMEAAIKYAGETDKNPRLVLMSSIDRKSEIATNIIQQYTQAQQDGNSNPPFFYLKSEVDDPLHQAINHARGGHKQEAEKKPLIPEILHTLRIVKRMIGRFDEVVAPYADLNLTEEHKRDGKETVGDSLEPVKKFIEQTKCRLEDMIKIWLLIKEYEQRLADKSDGKLVVANPDAQEPQEPINIRVLRAFYLHQIHLFVEDYKECQKKMYGFGIYYKRV